MEGLSWRYLMTTDERRAIAEDTYAEALEAVQDTIYRAWEDDAPELLGDDFAGALRVLYRAVGELRGTLVKV